MLELFTSDIHWPYHDEQAWALTVKVAKDLQPKLWFFGGDNTDFYALSDFQKDPKLRLELQNELDCSIKNYTLARNTCPNAQFILQAGNHEARWDKYLISKAPELKYLDACKLPTVLHLDKLEIEYLPNGTRKKIGNLNHIHGNEFKVSYGTPAMAMYNKIQANVIFGHYHRVDAYYRRCYDGHQESAHSNGCLSSLEVEYMHHANWQQSFSLIEYDRQGNFIVEQIVLHRNEKEVFCLVRGKRYSCLL